MSQKSTALALIKIILIIVFLPFALIWYVWKETKWNKTNKWIATTGIMVVFLFSFFLSGENTEKQKQEGEVAILSAQVESLQKQLEEEKQKNAGINQVNPIQEEQLEEVEQPKEELEQPTEKPEQIVVETQEEKFRVMNVIDGDTIKLDNGQVVRYIGIDAPETVHPSKPVQCFGKEASEKNTELVEGKEVKLVKDISETDRYGRLLRYVYIDNMFVNDYLVRNGYANASSYPPDIKHQDQFKEAEKEARDNKRGLWADDACKEVEAKPVPAPTPKTSDGLYTCDCSKTCASMSSCAEAQYQLNVCGCSRRDGDKDGIACDADCQ